MAFKIALTAGHYLYTAGKKCLKSLDPKQTREWVLNDRIADKIEQQLKSYDGYKLIRTDDTPGQTRNALEERVGLAEEFGADFYLSIHHNAGINGGKGGGIVAYIRKNPSTADLAWQKALYDALIQATGLKGNRSNPKPKKNLYECSKPSMPSVLLELGFMDSRTDTPIILTEEYADKCATAIVSVLAERGKLTKKDTEEKPAEQPQKPEKEEAAPAGEIGEDSIVAFKKSATKYHPAGSKIPAWVKNDYNHVVTQATSKGKPVIKGGVRCVLLGKRMKQGSAKVQGGINSWVALGHLELGSGGVAAEEKPAETTKPATSTTVKVDGAKTFTKSLAGTYKVNSDIGLNLRAGASTKKAILEVMPDGSTFRCYGFHTNQWLYGISASGKKGFCSKTLLKKK